MHENKTEITHKARRAFYWVGSTALVWQTISWAFTLITLRILTPGDYGIAAFPETVLPYFVLLAEFGLSTWIVQRNSFSERDAGAVFLLTLVLGISVSIIAIFIAPLIATFYNIEGLQMVLIALFLTLAINAVGIVPDAKLRRELRFKALSLVNLSSGIFQVTLTLVLAFQGYGYWALIFGKLGSSIVYAIAVTSVGGLPRSISWNSSLFKEGLRFGFSMTGASILWIIFTTTDDIVVGRLFGAEMLGFYTMAYYFSQLPLNKIQSMIGEVLVPYYSRLKSDAKAVEVAFLTVSRITTGIAGPVLVGALIVAPEAINIVLGERWLPIVPALRVLCAVALLQTLTVGVSSLMNALGKPEVVLRCNAVTALLLPALFIIGGNTFGVSGVYWAWLLGYPVSVWVILRALARETGIQPVRYIRNFGTLFLALFSMALVIVLVRKFVMFQLANEWLLALEVALAVSVYGCFVWRSLRKELALLREAKRA